MFQLDRLLESSNLMSAYASAAIVGAMLAIVAMQMSWNEAVEHGIDPPLMLNFRRVSFVLLALALMWSVSYAETKGWQPWPPALAIVMVLDFYLGVLIVMIARKSRASWHDTPEVARNGTIDH